MGKLYKFINESMLLGKKLIEFNKVDMLSDWKILEIKLLSIKINKIIIVNKEIIVAVKIFIEKENISFDAKEVT